MKILERAAFRARVVDMLHERTYSGVRSKLIKLVEELDSDESEACKRPTMPAPPPSIPVDVEDPMPLTRRTGPADAIELDIEDLFFEGF